MIEWISGNCTNTFFQSFENSFALLPIVEMVEKGLMDFSIKNNELFMQKNWHSQDKKILDSYTLNI